MTGITWKDDWQQRIERYLQLLRGRLLVWRGAHVGTRFGLAEGVKIAYPGCLYAGDDVTILEYSSLHCLSTQGVRIGNFTSFDRNLWLHCGGTYGNHDHGSFVIGDYSYIGCNAVIGAGGGIWIGSHVLIGQSVNMHSENHNFKDASRLIAEQGVTYKGITIEDDVWIGSKVTILDGVKIGRGAVIAANAVVTKSIPEYAIAVGLPAKVVGTRRGPST